MRWFEIAKSNAWGEFWSRPEVTEKEEATRNAILHGRHDAETTARLRGRLDAFRELRELPERMARMEEEASRREAEEQFEKEQDSLAEQRARRFGIRID